MLKKIFYSPSSHSLLTTDKNICWTTKRHVSLALQLILLWITLAFITLFIISLGEGQLQQQWATKRYSELQTIGTLLADKIQFQQFRTQILSQSETVRQYVENTNKQKSQRLANHLTIQWQKLEANIPELIGISIYDHKGKPLLASASKFAHIPLTSSLIKKINLLGTNQIYSSPMQFFTLDGTLKPFMQHFTAIENKSNRIIGYFSTANSMSETLQNVKAPLSNHSSPLLIVDAQGFILSEITDKNTHSQVPQRLGENLGQTHPKLWQQMDSHNFGQFQGNNAIFVYFKLELTGQQQNKRSYFLVSDIGKQNIANLFSHWEDMLLLSVVSIGLLSSLLVIVFNMYRLEQNAKKLNIALSKDLFNTDSGWIITNKDGRIITVNPAAEKIINQNNHTLQGRSLKAALSITDSIYKQIFVNINAKAQWLGELKSPAKRDTLLRVKINQMTLTDPADKYLLINLNNTSELAQAKKQQLLYHLLNDNHIASSLVTLDGAIIKSNTTFNNTFLSENNNKNTDKNVGARSTTISNIQPLFANNKQQWQRIIVQLKNQSFFETTIESKPHQQLFEVKLKAHNTNEGDIEVITCTFTPRAQSLFKNDGQRPIRSTIMNNFKVLERYFDALAKYDRTHSSLLLIDINPATILNHVSYTSDIHKRQHSIETQMLYFLPYQYQISRWILGQLIIVMPSTNAEKAHEFANKALAILKKNGLDEGISIGISSYQANQSLQEFLANAEVALSRAKKNIGHPICQAYTQTRSKFKA